MNYDSTPLPESYHKYRALTSADVSRWVTLVQEFVPQTASTSLIDLGCGTGRFTVPRPLSALIRR
jgi:trans-aconitate methyltransferase